MKQRTKGFSMTYELRSTLNAQGCMCCLESFGRMALSRRKFLTMSTMVGFAGLLPKYSAAASGNYDAMLLACIDPRFPKLTLEHMTQRSMVGKYSQFNIAGAAIGAVAPKFAEWHKTFWDNLGASIQLHNIPAVIAINHRDCGAAKIAYGDAAVASREVETETHRNALMTFRNDVATRFPKLKVELGLMDLNGQVEFFS
jgi:carbonic anhydrase